MGFINGHKPAVLAGFATCLVLGVGISPPLQAQTSKPASATDGEPASRQGAAGHNDMAEIVVTAQRRAERLQDVPITISVANAAQLERAAITNVRDLSSITAGLLTAGQGVNVIPAIRGVTSFQTDPGNDANVSLYIDGVYQPDQLANAIDLPDVDRVEVLKGPQGTLFGRNATGGAIRLFTRSPSLNELTGQFNVGYGNYEHYSANGFIGVPLIPGKLAASVSASYDREDSYTFNIVDNSKTPDTQGRTVRVKLLAQPTETLSIEAFSSYMYRTCGDCDALQVFGGNSVARVVPGAVFPSQRDVYASNRTAVVRGRVYTAGLRASLDTTLGQFVSTTSYNKTNSYYFTDADGSNLDIIEYPIYKAQSTKSQELLFTSEKFGKFSVVGGLFYYGDSARYDLGLIGSAVGGAIQRYGKQRTEAYAGFGEITFQPSDRLTFIAGARYSHEQRKAYVTPFGLVGPEPGSIPALGDPVTYNRVTPRASVRYQATSAGDNVYFTYSRGFKSGGFAYGSGQPLPFKPEGIIAYEIGLKTAPYRIVSANLAGFYYDYKNQQVNTSVNNLSITNNAASSRIYGVDADLILRASREFTVNVSAERLHAKYKDYPDAIGNVLIRNGDGTPCLCGYATQIVDLSGGQEPLSPKLTLSVGANYKKMLEAGELNLSANLYHTSRYSYHSQPTVQQAAYTTLALRASFEPAGSKFSFYAWGKNVTNRRYFITEFESNSGDFVAYSRPASYGGGIKVVL